MAEKQLGFKDVNAMGNPPYEVTSRDGGDDRSGKLGQTRPTGILATGAYGRKTSLDRVEKKRDGGSRK